MALSSLGVPKSKTLEPFQEDVIAQLCLNTPTPFHLYDEAGIRGTCLRLKAAFKWSPNFTNYFAVKAAPNPHLMKIMIKEGFGADCSSLGELMLSEECGLRGDRIMFTSNNTSLKEYKKAKELGAIINLDDISHVDFIDQSIGLPPFISFRYNPGPRRTGNVIIGDPKEAKFGLTRDQLFDAYRMCRDKGVRRFGLHAMVVSNCVTASEIGETARMLFEIVKEVHATLGIKIEMVNLGGGIGVNYKPEQTPMDLNELSIAVRSVYDQVIGGNKELHPLRVVMENGRYMTGPNGCLVTRIIHQKNTYKNYIGVDACMANLMRPGMYGAYHHISVIKVPDADLPKGLELPKDRSICPPSKSPKDAGTKQPGFYDVVGGLCENNDKFAVDRQLGTDVRIGDIAVIHDAGAHGHSMGFNYNAKLRSAEYLVVTEGQKSVSVKCIRRAETYGDLFATIEKDQTAWNAMTQSPSSLLLLGALLVAGAAVTAILVTGKGGRR